MLVARGARTLVTATWTPRRRRAPGSPTAPRTRRCRGGRSSSRRCRRHSGSGPPAGSWLYSTRGDRLAARAARGRARRRGGHARLARGRRARGARGLAAELDLEEPVVPGTPRACGWPSWARRWRSRPARSRRSPSTWRCSRRPRSARWPSGGEGRGGSSTMPHKRNPVGSVLAIACARRVRGETSILLAAMAQEHERAAGAWQAEWEALGGALAYTGGGRRGRARGARGAGGPPRRACARTSTPPAG